jgi:hypothetical protein
MNIPTFAHPELPMECLIRIWKASSKRQQFYQLSSLSNVMLWGSSTWIPPLKTQQTMCFVRRPFIVLLSTLGHVSLRVHFTLGDLKLNLTSACDEPGLKTLPKYTV